MTCLWQHPASKNGDIARLCDKEGHPFCKEHQFIAEVLEETEAVTREICKQRERALAKWQTQVRRLRLLVEHADELAPSAFLKRVHEALPELHHAAMAAVIYTYISSAPKED
jgi:hypothetical protein